MLAGGARSRTALDRFGAAYSSPQAKQWYRAVEDRPGRKSEKSEWIVVSGPAVLRPKVRTVDSYSPGASSLAVRDANRLMPITCSATWYEHTMPNWRRMVASSTDGRLCFDSIGIGLGKGIRAEPLRPLDVVGKTWAILWLAMGSNRGYPNRLRHHELWRALKGTGLEVRCLDRTFYSAERVRLERLHPNYREMPVQSLLTADCVYVCHWDRSASSPESRVEDRA